MAQIRLPLVLGVGAVQAAAPSFQEVPGTYLPLVGGKVSANGVLPGVSLGDPALQGVTVLVNVPDEDVTNGALDVNKIKARYPNHWLLTSGAIK